MAQFCRFEADATQHYGRLDGERVEALSGPPWAGGEPTGRRHALAQVRLLAPCQPSKIVCLGRNYREHTSELGHEVPREPLIFLKPPSAVIGPEEAIVYPRLSQRVDYEGELALVVGRRCRGLRADEDARAYVFGYTCLNDVTARDLQQADGQWTRAKSFDTFCPLGPVLATGLEPQNLILETHVNGERRQRASTREMIFPLDAIIRFIASVMTLEPGDVISTGTPAGVGSLHVGDVVEVSIEGIGRLRNQVVER
ncbi:MAG: fumarylacetoacetate hydrolase family protein [Acidobacteria bacterium]|nr:fumarylacetoacetate hydrolase family protein [Acidobacteriota bacterium]